jgi:hypothetical protein
MYILLTPLYFLAKLGDIAEVLHGSTQRAQRFPQEGAKISAQSAKSARDINQLADHKERIQYLINFPTEDRLPVQSEGGVIGR